MKRKYLAVLLTVVMLISMAGCSNNNKAANTDTDTVKTTEGNATQAPVDQTDSSEPVEEQELNIAIFQGGYGDEYWNAVVKLFEESHEGVKVNMTISPTIGDIIRPQIVAGNAPDFISDNDNAQDGVILSMIKENALLEISDVFEGQNYAGTGTLKDDIKDGLLQSAKCAPYGDSKIYLAPFNTGPQGLIYNKTYFDQKGLQVPKTWDDFFALGEKAKADGRALFTYQGIYPGYLEEMLWPAIANAGGMEALSKIFKYEEGSFNNETVLSVLRNMQKIGADGYLLEGTVGMNHTESQSEMMLGKSLFITNGTWMESEMADAPREDGFEFAMAAMPTTATDGTQYVLDSCEQFSIPKAAKNPELAKEFLRFLYSDESVALFAQNSGSVYATKTGREVSKQYLTNAIYNMYGIYDQPNVKSITLNFETLPSNCKVVVSDEIFNPITSVMNGEMTAEQWAESVEAAFAQIRADKAAAGE
ncbi:MAG: transporter substrate-binding protein [Herbinix sp.]|nr:transporter substrate-binding protein [Herbinix sp.]